MELIGESIMWILVPVRLEMVLLSVQYRCMVCAVSTTGSKIVLDAPVVLLGDEAKIEACFRPFADRANLNPILVHCLRQTYHRLTECFDRTRWNSYMTWVMWNLVSGCLETVLVPVQYRC
jgi:hypothetical protein